MARDPGDFTRRIPNPPAGIGEWYEQKRVEAERLERELAGARAVLDAAREVVKRLERALELARYVGD